MVHITIPLVILLYGGFIHNYNGHLTCGFP